ncbi:MAG: efflux RND transporter periplasmic adaptor subunit [Gammaproteobacteria bacterium]|nr:efflux RND transporter periplasmic adaptor subunit [Gammaproteobacteria bacterium]
MIQKPPVSSLAIGCLILILVGCNGNPPGAGGQPNKPRVRDHLVEVERIGRAAISTAHERSGTLRARRQVRIHSQEEGQVKQVPFFEGDRVKQGDIVVQLDDELLGAQLEKAVATSRLARVNLSRLRDLVKKRAASDDELARAETALEVALAEQKLLEARVRFTRIEAPIDGVVSERNVEPGDVAAKLSHLMTLVDPESLLTEIHVSELLLPRIKVGDPVTVRIDALKQGSFAGRIKRIHPALDPVTRQGVVEVELNPVPAGARPGQFARVRLESALSERILVPFESVKRDRAGEYVFLLNDQNHAIRAPVKTGIRVGDKIELLDGVTPGQQVISRGFLGLTEGQQVKPVNDNIPGN